MKPTVVISPGAWHLPAAYAGIANQLKDLGYETRCLALPTDKPQRPDLDMLDDADCISELITSLADLGADVVLVMHSYSGFPGSQVVSVCVVQARVVVSLPAASD